MATGIERLREADLPAVNRLWQAQYAELGMAEEFPPFLPGGQGACREYWLDRVRAGEALGVKREGVLAGFLAWQEVEFHGQRAAFCPVTGYAASEPCRDAVLLELYCRAAAHWVKRRLPLQLWMLYERDRPLRDALFRMGFGAHVADSWQKTEKSLEVIRGGWEIRQAAPEDAASLLRIAEESDAYYAQSPLFLQIASRGEASIGKLSRFLKEQTMLAAWDGGIPVGFCTLCRTSEYGLETLSVPGTGSISGLGAYLLPAYRGRGLGRSLLAELFSCCRETGIPYLHVTYETANPLASRFWPRYFRPQLLSMRRNLNPDVFS